MPLVNLMAGWGVIEPTPGDWKDVFEYAATDLIIRIEEDFGVSVQWYGYGDGRDDQETGWAIFIAETYKVNDDPTDPDYLRLSNTWMKLDMAWHSRIVQAAQAFGIQDLRAPGWHLTFQYG